MINKKMVILVTGLFLITTFSSTIVISAEKQSSVQVWITAVGHTSYHDASGYHIDVTVWGDSNDDDYGNLHLWYRASDADSWHLSSDYSACPGSVSQTLDYDNPGTYTVYLKLQLGDSGPVYYSDVWSSPIKVEYSSMG